jgi:outer membrane lipoprotein carrier protein
MARGLGLLLVGVVACGGASGPRASSTRNPADEVVQRVQAAYRGTRHLTARFRQNVVNKTFGLPSMNDGKLYVKRPDKMRWDYVSKRDRTRVVRSLIVNGNLIWAVDNHARWFYRQDVSTNALPVAVAFLAGTDRLARDFDARLLSGGKSGSPNDKVLELTPKRSSAPFKTLVLVVDGSSYRVKKSVVTSASGDTNELSFDTQDTTKAVADDLFVFDLDKAIALGYRAFSAQAPPPRSPP